MSKPDQLAARIGTARSASAGHTLTAQWRMTPPRPQPRAPSRKNHYVPVWYQTAFQVGAADNWLLDISTPRLRPDGTPIILVPYRRPAKSSFWENELYVTCFGEVINDQVETVLFQEIDNFGSDAVRAFVNGDEQAMHYQLRVAIFLLGRAKAAHAQRPRVDPKPVTRRCPRSSC